MNQKLKTGSSRGLHQDGGARGRHKNVNTKSVGVVMSARQAITGKDRLEDGDRENLVCW